MKTPARVPRLKSLSSYVGASVRESAWTPLKPGDDGAIKQYLAGRLMDVRGERDKWRTAHVETSSELRAVHADLEATSAELTTERDAAGRVEKVRRGSHACVVSSIEHTRAHRHHVCIKSSRFTQIVCFSFIVFVFCFHLSSLHLRQNTYIERPRVYGLELNSIL